MRMSTMCVIRLIHSAEVPRASVNSRRALYIWANSWPPFSSLLPLTRVVRQLSFQSEFFRFKMQARSRNCCLRVFQGPFLFLSLAVKSIRFTFLQFINYPPFYWTWFIMVYRVQYVVNKKEMLINSWGFHFNKLFFFKYYCQSHLVLNHIVYYVKKPFWLLHIWN